jgi:hypothetical protein
MLTKPYQRQRDAKVAHAVAKYTSRGYELSLRHLRRGRLKTGIDADEGRQRQASEPDGRQFYGSRQGGLGGAFKRAGIHICMQDRGFAYGKLGLFFKSRTSSNPRQCFVLGLIIISGREADLRGFRSRCWTIRVHKAELKAQPNSVS